MGEVFVGLVLGWLLVCTIQVVRVHNLIHAVFWLATALITTSVVLIWLAAPFLAGIQIVLYTGGVITLMLFGVMLTHRDADVAIPNPVRRPGLALAASALFSVPLLVAIWTTEELDPSRMSPTHEVTAKQIGAMFLNEQLLAFEVLSVLLLGAMIGAIVLARRRDP